MRLQAQKKIARPSARRASSSALSPKGGKLKDVLVMAEERGLFHGARTKVVRGRMPEALVKKAKARTGIKSDTDLLELALANLAVSDDFPEWLLSRKGKVRQDLDLEF
ncbi:MAG: hypothetical protein JWO20_2300 [Candidatus Angelobacter sp.]|jgi:hypothetical protein|nr:hypothetical protein [Candidatus Angelobacter sp.]